MSEQRHVIKRQVIELTIQGQAQAQPLQDELSRVYRQRILPLIDRRCSEASSPDQVYRIDRLDLDLGELNPDSLEKDLVAKVDEALSRELVRQMHIQNQDARQVSANPRVQSQLELFAFFASKGSLPWWADAARADLLAENLRELLNDAPEALTRLLQVLLREPAVRQRLANQYDDEQLQALSGLLAPACAPALKRDFGELLEGLQRARAASGGQTTHLRPILWSSLLQVAGLEGQKPDSLGAFYQAILKRVGFELGSSALPADFHREAMLFNHQLAELIERLASAAPVPPGGELIPSSRASERLAQLRARGGPLLKAWAGLADLLPELPASRQAALEAVIEQSLSGAPAQITARRILQILLAGLPENPGPKFTAVLELFRSVAGDFSPPEHRASSIAQPETIDLNFSEAGEYPLTNAGLVILWPFLGHFFTRLGLVDEDQAFKDIASRHRAAGLLQVVATRDAAPPEYLLPLNKLLCGLDLEDVFEFGPALLESEAQECENLLEAVISQAPILHNMSPDGFRGSFLLRAGVLGARDGLGLLRVERQTYDIVLERFPWSWEWVRLPWMEAPLRVEW